jgi:tRNA nucleotidyltransferase/poly(A) polymerase
MGRYNMDIHIPTQDNILACLQPLYPSVDLLSIFSKISDSQTLVYGGLLRDLALGRQPKEADLLIVSDRPMNGFEADIEKLLWKHGFTMLGKVSREDSANYHYLPPGKVDLKSIIDINLGRRLDMHGDFTINNLYFDLFSGQLFDADGGLKDLEKKILRTVEDPHNAFRQHPLLIFRAIKCICQFGLNFDPTTKKGLLDNAVHAYETMTYVADHHQTLLGEWMLDNMFRGLAYDPYAYFSLCREFGVVEIFCEFLSERLLGKSFAESTSLKNPFVRGERGVYEDNLSIFLSILAREFVDDGQEAIFDKIVELFGFALPNKYHPVGIDGTKMRFRETNVENRRKTAPAVE